MSVPRIGERYENRRLDLEGSFVLLDADGRDAGRFLAGQLTSDVGGIPDWTFRMFARLDRTGRVAGFGHVLKSPGRLRLLVERGQADALVDDLGRYVVTEDASFRTPRVPFDVEWVPGEPSTGPADAEGAADAGAGAFSGVFWGEPARILVGATSSLPALDPERAHLIRRLNGWPAAGDGLAGRLVSETRLDELAVDYDKGCFLGQETAAKIRSGRGPASFPMLLEVDGDAPARPGDDISMGGGGRAGRVTDVVALPGRTFLAARAGRRLRVDGRRFDLSAPGGRRFSAVARLFPLFPDGTPDAKNRERYAWAVGLFKEGREEEARAELEGLVRDSPRFADAYESLGVLLGRGGEHGRAAELMDRLVEVDPSSVMAHANKSLALMRMGRIKEAEEEKALATVKSFERHGREAQDERARAERGRREAEDAERRERMFREVLGIDPSDPVANLGLGEILLARARPGEARSLLEAVLAKDGAPPRGWLLLGRALEALGKPADAKAVYERGVEAAAAKGDSKTAGEMQGRLSAL